MSGIIEKYNQFKESTYFAGGKFVIYATCVCLVATFAVGCLGLIIGFPLLTFPLAMLISHPVIWIIMGIVVTAAYKMVVKPLFHLAKNYINGKGASKGEKSESMDSGVDTISRKTDGSDDTEHRSSSTSLDSGLGGKEFHENLDTLAHQTSRGNYAYWLTNSDIEHVARVVYGYSKNGHSNNNVYFLAPGYSNGMSKFTEKCIQDYREQLKQNNALIFTSVFHINGNHWTTLVIKPDTGGKKFKAYYCDSFGNQLPDNVLNIVEGELKKEGWTLDIRSSKTKQQGDAWNCGIFALENARRVTQMLNEGKSFDEIDKKLSEYKFDLNEKRREFAEALMNDEKWKEDLGNGLLCDLPPRTKTSSTSEVQHPGSFCNIM
ncbi:ULP_PROTEASE domain-containing protein [Trichonephila inaurata madagascariensis]|uniref:ULP_PROTEASE domain-containing protein n=1 Tax=Trichonephila inaurata madagascariensis TaxID=2747483 RepID=A0A8X7CP27_9ARAC|nr:ULP_PROTEASE domain-containing protein [Trichonephila inaurata madagascariensis]